MKNEPQMVRLEITSGIELVMGIMLAWRIQATTFATEDAEITAFLLTR